MRKSRNVQIFVEGGCTLHYLFTSRSEQDTAFLAETLARKAIPGTVIVLNGDLGAGKTRFSQAYASALGVEEVVNSPTFVIIKEYTGKTLPFYHMDVYRLSVEEADELGLEEYLEGDGVTLVEWGELIKELLPEERMEIWMERIGDHDRQLRIIPSGEVYSAWCEDLYNKEILQREEEAM